jgi:hypothetical protein
MPKFIVEREIPGASKMTEAELRDAALKSLEVLRQLGPEIQWIHSYVTDDKIYCIYFARDESLILEHSRLYGALARIDRIQAVRWLLDPSNFEQTSLPAAAAQAHTE